MTWKPGESGNPQGRKPLAREREYLRTVQRLCDPKTWGRIVERAIADALEGDRHAREWLGNYLLGRPAPIEAQGDSNGAAPAIDTSRLVAVLTDDEVSMLLARLAESEKEATHE